MYLSLLVKPVQPSCVTKPLRVLEIQGDRLLLYTYA
jgi:hypothetical protein